MDKTLTDLQLLWKSQSFYPLMVFCSPPLNGLSISIGAGQGRGKDGASFAAPPESRVQGEEKLIFVMKKVIFYAQHILNY
jgi:hypothetical protein